ncbi:MAG: hypothetical protein NT075_24855 [Chloroflexi bacterium]|nr:hypothetical protein [Chloroflexota bacterium]
MQKYRYFSKIYQYFVISGLLLALVLSSCNPDQPPAAATSPNLIASYHIVALANLLHVDLGDQAPKTVSWIRDSAQADGTFLMPHSSYPSTQEDILDNIYYVTQIAQTLGSKLPYPAATIALLRTLQMPDGTFRQFPNEDDKYLAAHGFSGDNLHQFKLGNTYRALLALHLLNAEPANKLSTQRWLQAYWAEVSLPLTPKTAINIADAWQIDAILESLQWLQVDLTQLPRYGALVEQVKIWQTWLTSVEPLDYQAIDAAYTIQALTDLLDLPLIDLTTSFVPRLLRHQNSDGGFDLFLQNHSEPTGSFEAISVLVRAKATIPNQEKLRRWIERRKSPYGGFTSPLGCNTSASNLPAYCDYVQADSTESSQPTPLSVK